MSKSKSTHVYSALFLVLIIIPAILSQRHLMSQSDIDSHICKTVCQCFRRNIGCNGQDQITHIPAFDTNKYNVLSIQYAIFIVRGLNKNNFTKLTKLTGLNIIYSGLEFIENNTFAYLDNLRFLDLSSNNFSRIAPKAFSGLHLTKFYFERNNQPIVIRKAMFENTNIGEFSLMHNHIKDLPYEAFKWAQINFLKLFNNSIVTIDKRFMNLFGDKSKLIDLSNNPLYCGCEFRWFQQMMLKWDLTTESEILIKCYNPIEFRGRLVSSLSRSEFACKAPPIDKITIDINPTNIQMSCHSNINNLKNKDSSWYTNRLPNKSPWLTWKQYDISMQNEISHVETFKRTNTGAYVSLNITNIQTTNSFVCQTANEINMSNKVIVNLKMAHNYLKQFYELTKKKNSISNKENKNEKQKIKSSVITYDRSNSVSTNVDNGHFFFRKRFSILQMIGAVVGTFTFVVILVIAVHCSRQHVIKKRTGLQGNTSQFNNTNPRFSMLPVNQPNGAVYNSYVHGINSGMVAGANSNDYQKYYNSNDLINFKAISKDSLLKSSANFNIPNPPNNVNINNNNNKGVNVMTSSTHSYVYDDANNLNNNSSSNTLKSNNNRNNTTKSSASTSTSSTCNDINTGILPQPPSHPPPPLPTTTNNLIPIIQPTTTSLDYPLSSHHIPTTSATPVIIATPNNNQYPQQQQFFNVNHQQSAPFITT